SSPSCVTACPFSAVSFAVGRRAGCPPTQADPAVHAVSCRPWQHLQRSERRANFSAVPCRRSGAPLETFIYRVRPGGPTRLRRPPSSPASQIEEHPGEEMDEIRRPEDYDVSSTSDEDEAVEHAPYSRPEARPVHRPASVRRDRVRHLLAEIDALFQQNRSEAIGEALADSNNAALTAQEKELRAGRGRTTASSCTGAAAPHALGARPDPAANVAAKCARRGDQLVLGYNRMLAHYMQTTGFDLTVNRQPPKSLFVEVRCLQDYGQLETEDGCLVNLKKAAITTCWHSDTELLVRQGVLEHVVATH
uniref:DNA replication complex GINS protein PSF1 n=1 Tax=Macrostomum lignano TaxID=282301 RepID=A0A1I8FAQ9_9PLAT